MGEGQWESGDGGREVGRIREDIYNTTHGEHYNGESIPRRKETGRERGNPSRLVQMLIDAVIVLVHVHLHMYMYIPT